MDRAEALNTLKQVSKNVRYDADYGIFFTATLVKAFEMAIAALREQEQREQGCEVCKGITSISGAFNGTAPGDENHLRGVDFDGDFEFCPMCGRKLGGAEE